jgi:hypothetical protein
MTEYLLIELRDHSNPTTSATTNISPVADGGWRRQAGNKLTLFWSCARQMSEPGRS